MMMQLRFGYRNPGQSRSPAADYLWHKLRLNGIDPDDDEHLALSRKHDGWTPPPLGWFRQPVAQ